MPSSVSRFLASIFFARRTISAALLAIYAVTAAGVPLPTGGHVTSGEAYPCASHACGCPSAEQCWRSCCCFTLAERFDWAREHNVRPPDFAIAAAQTAGIDLCWLGIKSAGHQHHDDDCPYCSSKVAAAALPPCCQKHSDSCCDHETGTYCEHKQEQRRPSRSDRVVAWRALGCQGQSLNWLAAVPTLVVERPDISYDLPPVSWLGAAVSDAVTCVACPPDVPPPECA